MSGKQTISIEINNWIEILLIKLQEIKIILFQPEDCLFSSTRTIEMVAGTKLEFAMDHYPLPYDKDTA
jgi:hypothetical protein